MLKLSYSSSKRRLWGFFILLFPLYAMYGFVFLDLIIRNYFGRKLHYTTTGIVFFIIISLVVTALSYWYNYRYYYDFLLDRKNKKIVLSRGNIKKIYNIDDIKIKAMLNHTLLRNWAIALYVNKDKYILRLGNMRISNTWGFIIEYDKTAERYTNRIKNILGITDTIK